MNRRMIPLLLCLTCGAAAPAQEAAQAPPRPSEEALDRLADLEEEIDEHVMAWREGQDERREKHLEEARKAAEEGRPIPALPMRPDFSELVDRLIAWADASGGEDAALYLAKAVELDGFAEGSRGRAAFDRLLRDHASSPSWARLGGYLPMLERVLGEARRAEVLAILGKSPDADVRGWVALGLHSATIEIASRDSEEYAEARAAILAAAAKVSDAELRFELEGVIALREKYGVGATAPDIEGIDLDGVGFKLSDYSGKVVFLDFWGDW